MVLGRSKEPIEAKVLIEGEDRLRLLISDLNAVVEKLDDSIIEALRAAKELKKAVDAAEAQRRRPLIYR